MSEAANSPTNLPIERSSVKHVTAAVGERSADVQLLHAFLGGGGG